MRALFALAVFLLSATLASAQATLTGSVADQTGGVLPGSTVTLAGSGERRIEMTDASGTFTFRNVAAGEYDVVAELSGFAAGKVRVTVGAGNVDVPRLVLATATINDTVVVSATKTDVRLIDAPATMSVIGANVLEAAPVQNYGDLLRNVPGINAIQTSARDVNLTSRAATSTLSNTELVLLDGRSVYLDFFGLVLWDMLPTNMSDIKQIEVVRGPASAVWGANAVSGAVNIITKSPRESVGTNVTISAGGFSRDAGSTAGKGMGAVYSANATVAQARTACGRTGFRPATSTRTPTRVPSARFRSSRPAHAWSHRRRRLLSHRRRRQRRVRIRERRHQTAEVRRARGPGDR